MIEKYLGHILFYSMLAFCLVTIGTCGHFCHRDLTTKFVYDFTCVDDVTKETTHFNKVDRKDITPANKYFTWYPEPVEETVVYDRCYITGKHRVKK